MRLFELLITVLLLSAVFIMCVDYAHADTLQGSVEQDDTAIPFPYNGYAQQAQVAPPFQYQLQQPQYGQQAQQLSGGAHQGYAGIGARLQSNALFQGIIVVQVYSNTPASQNDVEPGDIITAVNGESMWGHNALYSSNRIMGMPGTVVAIAFRRNNMPDITKQFIRKPIDEFQPEVQVKFASTLKSLGWKQ